MIAPYKIQVENRDYLHLYLGKLRLGLVMQLAQDGAKV